MSAQPKITHSDRLSTTLVFAILMHAAVVLGVSFAPEVYQPPETVPTLDVILVQRKSDTAPDEADYLAQVSQAGGGTVDEQVRPQAPITGQIPKTDQGIAPQPVREQVARPEQRQPVAALTQDQAKTQITTVKEQRERPDPERQTEAEQNRRAMELARLEAEIGREGQAYAKRPRRKFISANTKEYAYASYMSAWVAKVERIGNLNYPEQARKQNLSGNLVLTVAINKAGQVESLDIIQSSGSAVLDEAAVQIVEMGAPYERLPEGIRDEVDILHITRTWQFLPGNILRHR